MLKLSSTPSLTEFNPSLIPSQIEVIRDIRQNFNYEHGVYELLLSGSVGSAKSLLMAHVAVTHCLMFTNARVLLGRKSMPDLKDTILTKVLEHIEDDFTEGIDYEYNSTNGRIFFIRTKSEIICRSWGDKRYRKLRSLELSMAIIEELTENDSDEFLNFYKELLPRVGRLPHIPEQLVICATNPDAPSHAAYDYFINTKNPLRHVYYSITSDNPFLPETYIEQLKQTFTKQEAQRMLYGRWIEIKSDVIYYAFDESKNVIDNYVIDYTRPIWLTYDFNIGVGKPMSCVFFQYKRGVFYFFNEIIIQGARTLDTIDEAYARNLLNENAHFIITGDATGKARSTNYNKTDYEVIEDALRNSNISYEIDVRSSNLPVRKRHLIVNGQLQNAKGESKIKIVRDKCPTLIKGFRLTQLKKGSNYIEDDGPAFPFQHCTTAAGYGIIQQLERNDVGTAFSHGKYY